MASARNLFKRAAGYLNVRKRRRRVERTRQIQKLRIRIATEENQAAGLFDEAWYVAAYPDVAGSGMDAFAHYITYGYKEARDPGPEFDNAFYKQQYPDVIAAGTVPLLHYLDHGRSEGRAPNPRVLAAERPMVRHTIVKEMRFVPGTAAAILASHAPAGRLKPHVLPYIRMLADNGVAVLLVVAVDCPLELRDDEIAAPAGIIVRQNIGYDFGAWAHALAIEPALYGASLLVMTNDSVVPTADGGVFRAMMDRVRGSPADIVALTASHEYGWHVQSYFLALKPKALAAWGFQHFMRGIRRLDDKDQVVRTYEVPFAARMQAAGLRVEALFSGMFAANPTFFSWRELIEQGFPFIKLLMLRKSFAQSVPEWLELLNDVQTQWPDVLAKAGFDIDLVHAAVRAAETASFPVGDDAALLVDAERYTRICADHAPRVAFIGPWNYESGLSAASREMICALRRTGVQLNIYPITKPFHIHRPICPAVAITDFAGQPDIAIVHLNPDSWVLLSAEQRAIVASAKRRIGYWVWETDRVPPAWAANQHSVDRIWAPSQYCADVFAPQIGVAADVIPHAVPVPAHQPADRSAVLRRFGLDADARVILYVFDGASYLIRKNPEGLIRAFAAAGLAANGWTLLLKTKHLFDRPEAGQALAALVAATPGVRLTEASLASGEMTALMAAADIYASPHASEGFGLTVAEAMALGKPVVATDYSGTREFLDETCGYPVAWTPFVLDRDHGHYPAGHGWAKIDEAALAAALGRAAAAVLRGDDTIGRAARARVADALSYDAVAAAIRASFAALIAAEEQDKAVTRPKPPPPPVLVAVNLRHADNFGQLAPGEGVVPVILASDLTWNGMLPAGDPDDWLFLAPADAKVIPGAVHYIVGAATARPDVALFYGDDVSAEDEPLDRVRLKPDFDPVLLAAQDYIGAPVIVRRAALAAVGGLDATRGTAVLFDLVLRMADAGRAIARIPTVLLGFTGKRPAAAITDRQTALQARGLPAGAELVAGRAPGLLATRFRFTAASAPDITICIPTRRTIRPLGNGTYIEALLAAIATADWPMERLTVVVGDDIPGSPAWATQAWPFRLRRVETPREAGEAFNYASKMNLLWRQAPGEVIVFVNDDVTPHDAGWLHALAGFAVQPRVGGVGARLLYEDGALQHAGIYPAFGTVVHAWLAMDPAAHTYQDWALAQREWSMVTGAVFATRRTVLEQVDGFDEAFSLEFNDIDLCLRIRNLGHAIVCTPDAEFTHAEKASRGDTIPPGAEVALFLARWAQWLEQDPASHPGFAHDRVDLVPAISKTAWYR